MGGSSALRWLGCSPALKLAQRSTGPRGRCGRSTGRQSLARVLGAGAPLPHLSPMASLSLDIARIYLEPAVEGYARGREILARFPGAERIPVASHWRIPELRDGDPGDYLTAKKQALVLGVKKGLTFRPNGRSADYIAPSTSNGCAMACAYCYVARQPGQRVRQHRWGRYRHRPACRAAGPQGGAEPSGPARLGLRPRRERRPVRGRCPLGQRVRPGGPVPHPAARQGELRDQVGEPRPAGLRPPGPHARPHVADAARPGRLLDVRTAPVAERIAAIPELHRAGYEVHLNFSPVVLREGWEVEWGALFAELDDTLPTPVKDQLAAEIIMLTHNKELHEVNLSWHPKAEDLLWRPEIQEQKVSEGGGVNLRYRTGWKGQWLRRFKDLLAARMPYCRVRYAF